MLRFEHISGGYNGMNVVTRLDGVVACGQIMGVIGRNGVGKTSLAKLIAGILPISTGRLVLDGQDITTLPAYARRRSGIGYLSQTQMVFDHLTVAENLQLIPEKPDFEPYFDYFPRLKERLDQTAGTMSGGERKILGFVRAMAENTKIIILDEPSEGVQPENIQLMQRCLREKLRQNIGIMLIEQNINMLSGLADYYMGLDTGKIAYQGSAADTSRDELIKLLCV